MRHQSLLLLSLALPVLGAPDWNTLTGAGIVIAASSDSIRILTAAHVVADATAWKVYFYSDKTVAYTANVLPGSSDSLDLAVLEVRPQGRALPGNLPRLAMRDRETLPVDERIWSIDSEWVHIPNTVVRLDHDSDTRLFEYTKLAVDDGFSGGPVFDDQGRLVGVHRGGGAGGRYAVAAKLDSAIDALGALGHNTPNLVRAGTLLSNVEPAKPGASARRVGEKRVNPKDGLTYVWIPAGSFTMGCSSGDSECYDQEKPAHDVNITKGFWIGQTEVTQEAYQKATGKANPSKFKGAKLPVESVSWYDAQSFCEAAGMRLPTEAEWEYAARAGSKQSRYGDIDAIAWYSGNGGAMTHEAAQRKANAWGLYDTIGSVWEWTSDWYADNPPTAVNDPAGPSAGQYRVVRGGAWNLGSVAARVSYRLRLGPDVLQGGDVGVRCAGELP